jgi:hypothetical protein
LPYLWLRYGFAICHLPYQQKHMCTSFADHNNVTLRQQDETRLIIWHDLDYASANS